MVDVTLVYSLNDYPSKINHHPSTMNTNIVLFDHPYPPQNGGFIDLYYKIEALSYFHKNIQLFCFYKGDKPNSSPLLSFVKDIQFYPRTRKLQFGQPSIVTFRSDQQLLKDLQNTTGPIVFEGEHTTCFLDHPTLKDRYKIVRSHNVEWQYYEHLAEAASSFIKNIYYKREARLLKKHEAILYNAQEIWAISKADEIYFEKYKTKVRYLPAFHTSEEVTAKIGMGDFALYHGNLSVEENQKAVYFLLNEVIPHTSIKWVVAGKNPPEQLILACKEKGVLLKANCPEDELNELLKKAHINVLPTFQTTGIKLKLLNALYKGRHCLVNNQMLEGTSLVNLCTIAQSESEFIKKIALLQSVSFTEQEKKRREKILYQDFNNKENAKKIVQWLNW